MIKLLERLIHEYDAATVFVGAATVVVIIELSLMRVLVPAAASADNYDAGVLMEQVYSEDSVKQTASKLIEWTNDSELFITQQSVNPMAWQKELESSYVFGFEKEQQTQLIAEDMTLQNNIAEANYAVSQLHLRSVMTGRNPLANINGEIYRIGDEVPIRGGEIVVLIKELGNDYAIIELASCKEMQRTIYISRDMRMANGE
ncbi:MAG TPA: hypothetical protein EYO01_01630 [Phycisphaerales bacterium]|nr:hypothetical protein [Phycisphaerales bacterium]HIB00651.1 hypothetical protein [Phycisphaerales bacterium]HIB50556.1 hypothetical protein [Phycisphaerales bacterium]HIN84023.1 hypothetical protein [Phycisphaerales bacterium]HIO20129.1 hypothetical protein [Phycisphaerales bacterium]